MDITNYSKNCVFSVMEEILSSLPFAEEMEETVNSTKSSHFLPINPFVFNK